MSGICGAWSFGGGGPGLAPVLALLERRGPEGTRSWAEGPVGLGHSLLATTPEALVETLPLTDGGSGCTITADARIDNRDELIAALDLDGGSRTIGDGELILNAYLKWGDDCPVHLLGDFAFAIWDPREPRLFCARDHMGMRQLIYHHAPGRLFAFATEVDALGAHDSVPKQLNQGRIADFLDGLEGIDLTSTFFDRVWRLPPAHRLAVDVEGVTLERYWQLTCPPELKLPSDEAYAEAFMAVFAEAVRCRLRCAGPVGSMLSGGIDSNSVSAVAARLLEAEGQGPLMTFSGIGPDPESCVETRAICAAAGNPRFDARLTDHSELQEMLDDLAPMTMTCAEPFDAPMTLHRAIYLQAHRSGTKVVLDGVGGDVVLNAGNVVAELLHMKRFGEALRESAWRQLSFRHALAAAGELLSTIWASAVPAMIRRLRHRLLRLRDDKKVTRGRTLINPKLANRVALGERRSQYRDRHFGALPFGRDYRVHSIMHPHLVVGRERYDRVASALAIEPRDPFLDLRLIKFCLSLPRDQLHSNRFSKAILRRAMVGLVPADVIWRRGKEHVGWHFTQALLARLPDPADVCPSKLFGKFVNLPLADTVKRMSTNGMDRLRWFELSVLAFWLSRNSFPERWSAHPGGVQ